MNIYYAPPSQVNNGFIELLEQEATHASKVMRAREGDELVVVDGVGGRYKGVIRRITKKTVQVKVEDKEQLQKPDPALVLGMGIIKKRDRLEFAVEKAVELGASQICLFRSERTIKENVRMDRLESIVQSAMKQSLRAWLPEVSLFHSLDEMLASISDARLLVAHEKVNQEESDVDIQQLEEAKLLLLIGPEGGFSPDEIDMFKGRQAQLVSLGTNRLRAETAAVTFMSQFI